MKNALFFLFLVAFSSKTAAQAWVPVGTTWMYFRPQFGPQPPPQPVWRCIDTVVVGGHWCSELVGDPACSYLDGVRYFRKEAGKVFYWRDSSFRLLYDFGAPVGSFWKIETYEAGKMATIRVVSADSVFLNGALRRRLGIQIEDDPTAPWSAVEFGHEHMIEDIGSDQFLLPQFAACDPVVLSLVCHYRPDLEGPVNPCILAANEPETSDFSVFPNPTDGPVEIVFDQKMPSARLAVFDFSGKKISEPLLGSSVDLSEAAPGIYFLVVLRPDGRRFVKVVQKI